MANETFTLDGLALNDGTTLALDGNKGVEMAPPRQRQDWIGAADSEAQLLVRNPLHENRKVVLPLVVIQQATMDLANDKIGAVLDKLQKASKYTDGIALTWTAAGGTRTITFDVLSGEIVGMPVDWQNGWLALSPELSVELTCKPYWRGTETLTGTATSGTTPFASLEVAGVTGDVPALGRLIITDLATQSRRHVEWGLEGPLTYNSATSLIIDSDDMVTSGFAGAQATTSGAYDPNASGNNSITASPGPGFTTAVCGVGNLSHIGTFRVKARVRSGSVSNQIRLAWRSGDGPYSRNEWAYPTATSTNGWVEVDLGTITITAATVGTQRWTGQIEVLGASTSPGSVIVDYLILVPSATDVPGYGVARSDYAYQPGIVVAYDQFTSTTAGSNLNARVAPLGGTWATSGSATDLQFADAFSGEQITRTAAGDRDALLGTTTYTDVEVGAAVTLTGTGVGNLGLDARYVDGSNNLTAFVAIDGTTNLATLSLIQLVAASATSSPAAQWAHTAGATYDIRVIAYSSGVVIAEALSSTGSVMGTTQMTTAAIATGGALATGKAGIYDEAISGSTVRYYDDFYIATPAAEPIVVYSGKNMQVRYDDTLRQDSTGTYTGRPHVYKGSRFLVPVGTSRVLVKARRNDVTSALDDQVADATQIQVGWTPRGLAVPR